MSSKKKQEILKEQKDWEAVDQAVVTSERFIEKYQKQILIVIGVVVVIVTAFWAYKKLYMEPKTKEAQAALFRGEQYYQMGADSLAIYGDGNGYLGFEAIISEYSSTPTASLAKLYAGLCYTRMEQYEQALPYLKGFKGGDKILTHAVKSAIGDCLVNTGKVEEGAKQFVDAAKGIDDDVLAPIYYKKAGMAYRSLNNYGKVEEIFTTIKNKYINSPEAMEAEKYIEEAKILKGK